MSRQDVASIYSTPITNMELFSGKNNNSFAKSHEVAQGSAEDLFTPFESYALLWLSNLSPEIKESTKNKYRNLLFSYILPYYSGKDITSISYEFIQAHCNCLLKSGGGNGTGLSSKTVSDTLCIIRRILKYSQTSGIHPLCDGTEIKIKQKVKKLNILSRSEQECLYHYLVSNITPVNLGILVCLCTGLRIGEICALRWEDISFADNTIYVHRTLQRIQDHSSKKTKVVITMPKSECSIRIVPLPSAIARILRENKKVDFGFFLSNSETKYVEPRLLQTRFKEVLNNSKIKNTNFHVLRHTFATRCVEVGFDLKSLSEILGHANISITMNRYVHPSMELKQENMEKLSVLLSSLH